MTVAEANVILAVVIWVLVAYISTDHIREHGFSSRYWLLGATVLSFATLAVVSSLGPVLDVPIEALRLVAGFLRGVVLVLVAGYAVHRWRNR